MPGRVQRASHANCWPARRSARRGNGGIRPYETRPAVAGPGIAAAPDASNCAVRAARNYDCQKSPAYDAHVATNNCNCRADVGGDRVGRRAADELVEVVPVIRSVTDP